MKTAAFLTLGCKLNYAETSTYERALFAAGVKVVGWREKADVFLVNTCSVTAVSDAKSRNLVRRVHRINPEAPIYVTGCSAQLRADEISRLDGVRRVFGAKDKNIVATTILSDLGIPCAKSVASDVFPAFSTGERTRSFLKVQDGCDNFCAYCTVPFARGGSRNVPIGTLVCQAREIAACGVKEIVLTGVNTGDFGKTTGESFLDLLKALDKVGGIERFRISSIEPNLLTEDIIDWIASGTKFQPHFHIPLQTGSDLLLARMGRRYDTALFADRIGYIRSRMEAPGKLPVFFGIDLMTGLPGESEELFLETLDFLRKIRPSYIHVFPYSRRPGTPASVMEGQVSEAEKSRRLKIVEELSSEFHSGFCRSCRGMKVHVLFESSEKSGMMTGYTENYLRVERPYDSNLTGRTVEMTYEG